jgi:hypothetical protein
VLEGIGIEYKGQEGYDNGLTIEMEEPRANVFVVERLFVEHSFFGYRWSFCVLSSYDRLCW